MKTYIVIAVLLVALYWHYSKKMQDTRKQKKPVGVARTTSSNIRQATQISGTGSASPGSGVVTRQPPMLTTWGIAGRFGAGFTGPSYAPDHASRTQ